LKTKKYNKWLAIVLSLVIFVAFFVYKTHERASIIRDKDIYSAKMYSLCISIYKPSLSYNNVTDFEKYFQSESVSNLASELEAVLKEYIDHCEKHDISIRLDRDIKGYHANIAIFSNYREVMLSMLQSSKEDAANYENIIEDNHIAVIEGIASDIERYEKNLESVNQRLSDNNYFFNAWSVILSCGLPSVS